MSQFIESEMRSPRELFQEHVPEAVGDEIEDCLASPIEDRCGRYARSTAGGKGSGHSGIGLHARRPFDLSVAVLWLPIMRPPVPYPCLLERRRA